MLTLTDNAQEHFRKLIEQQGIEDSASASRQSIRGTAEGRLPTRILRAG